MDEYRCSEMFIIIIRLKPRLLSLVPEVECVYNASNPEEQCEEDVD